MSVAADLIGLVPDALELVRLLVGGDAEKAEIHARLLAETISIKRATRAAAEAGRKHR